MEAGTIRDTTASVSGVVCISQAALHVFFFFLQLLLSLNAHNHVDDYSATLGGVHKVHMSALVTSPKN